LPLRGCCKSVIDPYIYWPNVKTITTGLRWRWTQEPIFLRGDYDINFEEQCKELGAAMACALDEGII
jgi:hypothetical protein